MWCELRALLLAGGTCGTRETRETRGTFSSFEMPWQEPASIVSNTWLSALALRIVTWAVRFSANGSATLGINPCLAHCQFQESIVSHVPHVPLAICKSRSSAPCHWLFMQHSKREALVRAQECARTEQARRLACRPSVSPLNTCGAAVQGHVLHGTPGRRHGVSAIEAADRACDREPTIHWHVSRTSAA